jgi:hypothetical protein
LDLLSRSENFEMGSGAAIERFGPLANLGESGIMKAAKPPRRQARKGNQTEIKLGDLGGLIL